MIDSYRLLQQKVGNNLVELLDIHLMNVVATIRESVQPRVWNFAFSGGWVVFVYERVLVAVQYESWTLDSAHFLPDVPEFARVIGE